MVIGTVIIYVWIFYFHSVLCIIICWKASVIYVNLIWRIYRMDVNVSDFSLWSGMMMSFCVQMISGGSMWCVIVGLMAVTPVCEI